MNKLYFTLALLWSMNKSYGVHRLSPAPNDQDPQTTFTLAVATADPSITQAPVITPEPPPRRPLAELNVNTHSGTRTPPPVENQE
jgi:hypothetical protein